MTSDTSPGRTLIGLGELLWDCFADSRRPGGAPANVAYHACQLGLDGVVCTRVGTDADGDQLIEHLRNHGMNTRYVQRDADHPTGTVTVDASRPDDPSYTIHEDVAWDYLELSHDWRHLFRHAAAVCFGTLAQRTPRSRATIQAAVGSAQRALRVYDVNLRPPHYATSVIEASLHTANVFKLNQSELQTLAEMLGLAQTEPVARARALLERYGGSFTFVTRGAEGCLAVTPDEVAEVHGREIEVADAVGAGDAFTAALTFGLLRQAPLATVAEFANEVGGLVASQPGAMPDVRRELAELTSRLA